MTNGNATPTRKISTGVTFVVVEHGNRHPVTTLGEAEALATEIVNTPGFHGYIGVKTVDSHEYERTLWYDTIAAPAKETREAKAITRRKGTAPPKIAPVTESVAPEPAKKVK